jgi:hypothetical protein
MHKPANDRPNVLPANVSNLRDELQRLAATGKPDGRGGKSQLPARDARTMVIRGMARSCRVRFFPFRFPLAKS